MISFTQVLILLFIILLLFGDVKKFINGFFLMILNLKEVIKKKSTSNKNKD